jgi:hypothetical protein
VTVHFGKVMSVSQSTPINTNPARSRRLPLAMLVRVSLVLTLLIGSSGVRSWQAHGVNAKLAAGRESPFPLETIPMTLGTWIGSSTEMDARIVQATGSTDHITRRYIDQRTGVAIDAIILYGPTSEIFIHGPELCYPKAGFTGIGESPIREIPYQAGRAPFRSLEYTKGDPGQVNYQEVYYSWRYNGHWSTSVSSPKESERIPGMYKVQLARPIGKNESRTVDNPCEAFLELLIPDLEARITGQAPPPSEAKPKA